MHVRALRKGVGSVKRYRKEDSDRSLRGDAGFANKGNLPHHREQAAPLPLPPPLGPGKQGGTVNGGGGGHEREGRGRVGSEGARKRDNNL